MFRILLNWKYGSDISDPARMGELLRVDELDIEPLRPLLITEPFLLPILENETAESSDGDGDFNKVGVLLFGILTLTLGTDIAIFICYFFFCLVLL